MIIEQIYTGCLAQGAYYIESNGEAAIIDPLRETAPYIQRADKANAKIKYIFETHFHADFVSGHLTLAQQTGATIVYGPTAQPKFDCAVAEDNQVFQIGDVSITVLHTPGHTMESSTFLLKDKNGQNHAIFSGDTLFLGDVGRPDLAQKAANMTQEELAGLLFDSLRTKIMPLADDIIVYPGHGAGSACGKNMMNETVDTLGNQKKVNYALRADMTRDEFIEEVIEGLQPPPAYFPMNVQMNKEGYESLDEVLDKGNRALSPEEFELVANESGALILDVRHEKDFIKGFIPQSIFIGLDGSFAPWVGALIADVKQPILLVLEEKRLQECITRLARVGFDQTIGYLKGGIDAWKDAGKELDSINSISASTFEQEWANGESTVIDVRREGEYQSEHLENAINIPLDFLNDHLSSIPKEDNFYLHCLGGYRSVITSSILKSRGYHNMINIEGGYDELKKTDLKKTDYVCPTEL
ncbi:MAG: MBL fold metallo-hydrolase [Bacteroidia bacterium]